MLPRKQKVSQAVAIKIRRIFVPVFLLVIGSLLACSVIILGEAKEARSEGNENHSTKVLSLAEQLRDLSHHTSEVQRDLSCRTNPVRASSYFALIAPWGVRVKTSVA